MKTVIFLLVAFTCLNSSAQTGLIVHKSHSGNAKAYLMDPNSNFGVVPDYSKREYHYELLNDSMVQRTIINRSVTVSVDTLFKPATLSYRKYKKYHLKKNSPKGKIYYTKSKKVKQDSKVATPQKKTGLVPAKRENSPSFLFVLLAVSTAVLILVRLLFREREKSVI